MGYETIHKELFPLVPLMNYKKIPSIKWNEKENWIKSIEEFQVTIKEKTNFTGFSLLTGSLSGVMVVDIDRNHGDGSVDGLLNFKDFIKDLPSDDKKKILNTYCVATPSGGFHFYFRYKEGLKSRANYIDGVDIRTDGGLIVIPGSKVKLKGKVIEYKGNDDNIQEMPQSLFNKFQEIIKPSKSQKSTQVTTKDISNSYAYEEGKRNQELFREVIGIVSQSSIRDINIINSITQGLNLLKCKPPLEVQEVNTIVNSIIGRLNPSYCNEKGYVDIWELVQYIKQDQPCYKKGNLWYIYNSKKGFYEHMELDQIQRMYFEYPIINKDKTISKAKNFADLLMINSDDERSNQDNKRYINCLNGVIDTESDKLLRHDPNYKLEVQFQGNYNLEWKDRFNNSTFNKFLNDILDESSIITLQETWGLMLSPHTKEVQQCFIYKGEGSNGKSSLFDIQEALIGSDNYISSIGLGDFGKDFDISMAEGKCVNIVRDDDLSGERVSNLFKSMVCGESVKVNRKNRDLTRMSFNIHLFYGLNRLPSASDKSTGFFRRQVIIPFNTSFGTEQEVKEGKRDKIKDPTITQNIIKNELDIVFMWAYEGLKRVMKNNWKLNISKSAQEELEDYREEVDSAYSFFKDNIVLIPNSGVKMLKGEVYEEYKKWCTKEGMIPMSPIHFGRQLSSYGLKTCKSGGKRYYMDLQVKEDIELEEGIFGQKKKA